MNMMILSIIIITTVRIFKIGRVAILMIKMMRIVSMIMGIIVIPQYAKQNS